MQKKYVDVKFMRCDSSVDMNRAGGRLLSNLNVLFGTYNGAEIITSGKDYTYTTTDLNVRENDIVIVRAQGSISLAIVTKVSLDPPTNKSGISFKDILAKIQFPSGVIRKQKMNEILNKLFGMIPLDELSKFVIAYAEEIDSEETNRLLDEYADLAQSNNIKI